MSKGRRSYHSRMKRYRVRLMVAWESYNGYDHQEERTYVVSAQNSSSAYKKAQKLLRPNEWMRNGLAADVVPS